ncbi:MAG: hypothetical protein JRH08_11860 [Deltaproteobacteria bacterium]|nr:hypothetical protein [Deltaproteobacteria bacterium]MBW1931041.1 hypothetical protein [Deltaproteobacteria bacterium]MBW2026383.1 hypothetical protein [Deltaproteobacteria bacterium]MBW2126367.1 hypothetical protein [Deltaproteobacteria bacterium]
MSDDLIGFWKWFLKGSGGKPGYKRVVNRWIFVHFLIGILIAALVKVDLSTCANAVLLPLVGILIGLSFAWVGNAQALMQTSEIERLGDYHEGGFIEYVYAYQTAILTILATLVIWGLAGLHVFDQRWPTSHSAAVYFVVKTILFLLASLTLRTCWNVVLGAQWMLLTQKRIKDHVKKSEESDGNR